MILLIQKPPKSHLHKLVTRTRMPTASTAVFCTFKMGGFWFTADKMPAQ